MSAEENNDALGCVKTIITILVLWGLFFGVTWNGHHHGLSCSGKSGVTVE